MHITRRQITDRETWLQWRRQAIGASEIGALFGVHPYVTALRLYVEKRGMEFPHQETGSMRRGRILESAVGAAVQDERPTWTIEKAQIYLIETDLRIGATPDFWVHTGKDHGVLQAKTAAPSVYEREWSGGAMPPMWIVMQCLTEMMLAEVAIGAIAVLRVDPWDLKCSIFEIERHAAAEARIIAAVERFWTDVETGTEPTPDYGRDADLAAILVPRETSGKRIDLSGDNELAAELAARAAIAEDIKASTARKDEIDSMVRFKLGDAEFADVGDWTVSYKTQHRKETIIPAKDIRTLRITRKKESP